MAMYTPAPKHERLKTEEYDLANPPVIPCFYLGPGKIIWKDEVKEVDGKRVTIHQPDWETGDFTNEIEERDELRTVRSKPQKSYEKMYGWEQFTIQKDPGSGQLKVYVVADGIVHIMKDGYCEIPNTPNNRTKLAELCKPHDRPKRMGPRKDRDNNIIGQRLRHRAFTEPPLFKKASGTREFDEKQDVMVDRIRPWKRRFIKVPQAIMEEA